MTGRKWSDTEAGVAVPYEVFTSPEFYEYEQQRIFRGPVWSFVGLEAEVPDAGSYKTTSIGESPVVVTRDKDGCINVLQNRCAHRGATVCREPRGQVKHLECVYHQWAYDLQGKLLSVPFRRGVRGEGGMPQSFKMANHGLLRLRCESLNGVIFASFSDDGPSLREYLGEMVTANIERIFNRPIQILGDQRQIVHANWKLYAENTRDPYHASLLHLFHNTFGIYRVSQKGASLMDDDRKHSLLFTRTMPTNEEEDSKIYKDSRSFDKSFQLQDPSLLAGRKDFDDDIGLAILAVFPNLVVQQIANTLAVRQTITRGPDAFELVWTQFGYADDDDDMRAIRLKQSNLIGPAGLISMEDGEAVELVQKAVRQDGQRTSYIAMGGGGAEDSDHMVTEGAVIGFWQHYQKALGINETNA